MRYLVLVAVMLMSANLYAEKKSRFQSLELFNKILHLVEQQYYRNVDVDKLVEGALHGMMETLDPHSSFLNKNVFSKMQEDTQGEFGGLGIEVTQKDGVIYIIAPIDDTPAFRAGIKPGDQIVEINHESVLGISLEKAVDKMRGKPGEKVHIGIKRSGTNKIDYLTLKREKIKIKPVKSALVQKNYIFIRLTQFQNDSAKYIEKALKKLSKQAKKHGGAKGIVLDLRSNPGGLLDEAVKVSSLFLKDGVVVSTEGRDPKNKDIRYVIKTGYKQLKLPIVVLINGASASASEIVAGALQDHKRAIIVGTRSFGKGSVQTVAKVDDAVGVKLTVAQYMTPNDRKIQAVGIVPDVEFSEVDAKWTAEHRLDDDYVREADLRNHLTAVIETKEAKKERLEREKEKRKKRMKKLQALKNKKEEKPEEHQYKPYNPKEDYQVQQAVNYLKTYKIFSKK